MEARDLGIVAVNVLEKIDPNQMITNVFGLIQTKNYSECAMLLKDGKLGQTGYIAGTLINSLTECQTLSVQGHAKMQEMVVRVVTKAFEDQSKFESLLIGNLQQERELIRKICESVEKNMGKAIELVVQLSELSPDDVNAPMKLQLALKLIEYLESGSQNIKEIAGNHKVDEELVMKCMKMRKETVSCIMETVKEIGKQQSSSNRDIIEGAIAMARSFFPAGVNELQIPNEPQIGGPQQPALLDNQPVDKGQ